MGAKHFGARVTRFEDPALLTGRGRFTDDIALPGALNACFVRSPHGHAKIRSIDATAARAMPGVHAVLTADDLPEPMRNERIPNLMHNPAIRIMRTPHALARDEVCYVGQALAVVIADSRYLAEDAAAAVEVDYEILPAVEDCREAVKPGSPLAQSDIPDNVAATIRQNYGDVDAAFAGAAHVFEEDFWVASRRRDVDGNPRGRRHPRRHDGFSDRVVVDTDAASRPRHPRRSARTAIRNRSG